MPGTVTASCWLGRWAEEVGKAVENVMPNYETKTASEQAVAATVSCAASKNTVRNVVLLRTRVDDKDRRLLAHVLHLMWQHNAGVGAEHGGFDQHVRGRLFG